MDIAVPPFERLRRAIDASYYRQYCGGDEPVGAVPRRRPRRAIAQQEDEPIDAPAQQP